MKKRYIVTITRPVIEEWEFTVEAESEEQARETYEENGTGILLDARMPYEGEDTIESVEIDEES